ncbi:MAG: hypothetical protein PHF98_02765 [Patescibacteria group bacterium]|nr:hypothetical protein [Patescibacteria group bacterium]
MYKRYLPLEIFALLCSCLFAFHYLDAGQGFFMVAVAGTVGDMVGFYSSGFIRQIWVHCRDYHDTHGWRRVRDILGLAFWDMVKEHGIAGFFDDIFIRPFLLWKMPQWLALIAQMFMAGQINLGPGPAPSMVMGLLLLQLPLEKIGLVIGKLCADYIFYRVSYECRKRFGHLTPARVFKCLKTLLLRTT